MKKKVFTPKKSKSSQIELDPKLKENDVPGSTVIPPVKANNVTQVQERVLTLPQRVKRGAILRRLQPRLKRARDIAKRKMAKDATIKTRSERLARRLLKKRFAGEKGFHYQNLSPSEKIAIDKRVDGKVALIKKLAQRLYPKVKQAENVRLGLARKGKFVNINPLNLQKYMSQQNESLQRKAVESGYKLDIINEVFSRGISMWNEQSNHTPEQLGFARVNSFINKGKAYQLDKDLLEDEVNTAATKKIRVRLPDGRVVWKNQRIKTRVESYTEHERLSVRQSNERLNLKRKHANEKLRLQTSKHNEYKRKVSS